ncbi:hypothetical protein MCAV_00840 [[Mycoplasma] cavipharyngis]|uniref:hypothetical protein n=1 Tax=[Mycoplasma] cavipharyngis TaxID=92757 RepID=UPI003703E839
MKNNFFYQNKIFVSPVYGEQQFCHFLLKNQTEKGILLTLDFYCLNLKKQSTFYERYIAILINTILQKEKKLFFLTNKFVYAVFIHLDFSNDHYQTVLLKTEQKIKWMIEYINHFLITSKSNYQLRSYQTIFGQDFFDYYQLIKVGELGIYNSDYSDHLFLKQFDPNEFINNLAIAHEKKALSTFLQQYKISYILVLKHGLNQQLFYFGQIIDLKNIILDLDDFFIQTIPEHLKPIFLRVANFHFLKNYANLINPLHPLVINFPIKYLVNNQKQFQKLLTKITASKIKKSNLIFSFYGHEKIAQTDQTEIYQWFRKNNLKIWLRKTK